MFLGTRVNHRFVCLLLTVSMLWTLSACGSRAPEFPPTEETVQAAAEKVGWTLDPEATQTSEDMVIYTFETGDEVRTSFSFASAEGNRILMGYRMAVFLPDKPEFAWEDWEKTLTLAETLYGGFDEGELYKAFSQQEMPERRTPAAGPDAPVGQEVLLWEAELPAGYALVRWDIRAGAVEHVFPEPIIKSWMMTFRVSIYESKEAYKDAYKTGDGSSAS